MLNLRLEDRPVTLREWERLIARLTKDNPKEGWTVSTERMGSPPGAPGDRGFGVWFVVETFRFGGTMIFEKARGSGFEGSRVTDLREGRRPVNYAEDARVGSAA